jgi:hypothetical protein
VIDGVQESYKTNGKDTCFFFFVFLLFNLQAKYKTTIFRIFLTNSMFDLQKMTSYVQGEIIIFFFISCILICKKKKMDSRWVSQIKWMVCKKDRQ